MAGSLAERPVTALKGVGAKLAETLAKLDIVSIQDLLFHLPLRYLDRTRITAIGRLRLNTSVVIEGQVVEANIVFGRRRSLVVTVEDHSGSTCLRFYHFNAAQKNAFEPGRAIRCYGDPRLGSSGLEFYHPEYEFADQRSRSLDDRLTPIYGLTDGISQMRLRKLMEQAVALLDKQAPEELLSGEVNAHFQVESLAKVLIFLHFPPPAAPLDLIMAGQHPYQRRLAFEEMLAHHLARQQLRETLRHQRAPVVPVAQKESIALLASLPFALTAAQERVLAEIRADLAGGQPMLRMVQGDVGSGKTLVAALAALDVATAGYQVAIVAPTEILAEQHLRNFQQWLSPLGIDVAWLVGKMGAAQRRDTLAAIASGQAKVVIGTHALFQDDVTFAALGLAVVDEQHRFGVDQRLSLRRADAQGLLPHQLVMTATPIPRSLAMTAYSELDYSVIDELPPGRQKIKTALISQKRRGDVIERIRQACSDGAQVYWVCPLVEDSETLSAANAEETSAVLREKLQPFSVGLVHGRLKAQEKEQQMQAFKAAQTQLLVATTVIEVGVDVPNASLMIIENPERLGLAQLHQLRGRVGRGHKASHCVLLYGDKLSQQARERLQVLRESNDGFIIAERDLALRGPGELMGTRQTGAMQYRLADLQHHQDLIPKARKTARRLIADKDPAIEPLILRWIGQNKRYAQV